MSYLNISTVLPDLVMIQTETETLTAAYCAENTWTAGNITVQKEDGMWTLVSKTQPVRRVLLRWNNASAPDARILNDHYERGYGDLEWKGYNAERILPWYFMMQEGDLFNGYGVKTNPNAICIWQATESDITLYMDVRSLGVGVRLGDKKLRMAEVVTHEGIAGDDAFTSTRKFCAVMCTNGIFADAPVYGGNNWYYAYGHSSAEEILKDTDRIAAWTVGLKNRPFMVIDACWQSMLPEQPVGTGGPYYNGNKDFPDMAALAAEMKAKNVRPGIWCRPLLTNEELPAHWFLKEANGEGNIFDPTVPEALAHVGEDIRRIRGWGYELIKHDYSTYDILGRWGFQFGASLTSKKCSFADPSVTTAEAIQMLYKTIYDNADGALIIACNTVSHLVTGYAQIQRTGDDTSGIAWERTRKMGINTLSHRMTQHNIFYTADADCVGLTPHVPWSMNGQWTDLLARSATAQFISADPKALTQEIEDAIRAAFALASENTDMLIPVDWLHNVCPTTWKNSTETFRYNWNQPDRFVFADDDIKL